jgi:hypothetical protein
MKVDLTVSDDFDRVERTEIPARVAPPMPV